MDKRVRRHRGLGCIRGYADTDRVDMGVGRHRDLVRVRG